MGASISIDGDYAVTTGPTGDSNIHTPVVYRRTGPGAWGEIFYLISSNQSSQSFVSNNAGPVSISGDYIIRGEPTYNGDSGRVVIHRRIALNDWTTLPEHINPSAFINGNSGNFGTSVAISGDYCIVGAPYTSGSIGSAYFYKRTGTNTWAEDTYGTKNSWIPSSRFGQSVAMSYPYAAILSWGANKIGVYYRDAIGWGSNTPFADLTPIGVTETEKIAISGDYIISCGGTSTVTIFRRTDVLAWGDVSTYTASYPITDVSISGDYAILGARNQNAAIMIRRVGLNTWGEAVIISDPSPVSGDMFGYSVAISGENAMIGSPGDSVLGEHQGAVFAVTRSLGLI
jgi:hypothetical protein